MSGYVHLQGEHRAAEKIIAPALLGVTAIILFVTGLKRSSSPIWYVIWAASVLLTGFGVEVLGTMTNFPFGHYYYGDGLGFKLFDVPLVMGFAWLKMMILGLALLYFRTPSPWLGSFVAALCIVCYDVIMEPAAELLDYWYWMTPLPPVQNYISWFTLSFLMLLPAFHGKFFTRPFPRWCLHLFLAEEMYFFIVLSRGL